MCEEDSLLSERKKKSTYAWGLGQVINNKTEAYALLHGILLAKEAKIKALKIIKDSMAVIKSMLVKITTMDNKLEITIAQIKKELRSFFETSFFHLKRELNHVVD